jgi:hypothetical protein
VSRKAAAANGEVKLTPVTYYHNVPPNTDCRDRMAGWEDDQA